MDYKDLQVLFEDNHIIVVVKPENVPSQEDKTGDIDMLTLVKRYLVDKYNKPGDAYVGLVHRLDRPTGGVMVFAKTSKAASRLSEQIRNNEVEKHYMCLVHGVPNDKQSTLKCYLKKFEQENIVRVVPELTEGAKYAELEYKLLETKDNMSLIYVNLITGRGHQIRVQFSSISHPLVGDKKYGIEEKMKLPLCLWAAELRFAHPISGKEMVFRVFPPETEPWTKFDMEKYLGIRIKNIY
ncbi:MAG: RluA family pseudouridine synthase [Clostridia bacterium]|nr:RluA family pseudouridine synthase [Clostridia bacterium]